MIEIETVKHKIISHIYLAGAQTSVLQSSHGWKPIICQHIDQHGGFHCGWPKCFDAFTDNIASTTHLIVIDIVQNHPKYPQALLSSYTIMKLFDPCPQHPNTTNTQNTRALLTGCLLHLLDVGKGSSQMRAPSHGSLDVEMIVSSLEA